MRQNPDTMINNRADTLNGLQRVLDKYSEHIPGALATNIPLPQGNLWKTRSVEDDPDGELE
jgi:hypothetical protein